MEERPAHSLTTEEKKSFLALQPDDITLRWLQDTFGNKYNTKTKKIAVSKFETYDEFYLEPREYHNVERIKTTVGLFVINKFALEPTGFLESWGYWNKTLDKSNFEEMQDLIAQAVLEDTTDTLLDKAYDVLDRLTWISLTFHTEICASKSLKTIKPLPKVQAAKRRLLKENRKALDEKNIEVAIQIQNELIEMAKEELKDDPGYQLYDSSARGSFDNSYRQALLIKGPIWNANTGEWDIVENSLYEGFGKEDIPSMANAIIDGVYPKSIGTGECGYLTKKLGSTFQGNTLGPKGSDCKSKFTETVELDKRNISLYYYNYMVVGSKYVRLDPSMKEKYIGQTVKFRLPNCCINGAKLCNICAGDRFYLLGINNIGLTTGRVSNSLLRARMKQAHDATIRMYNMRMEDLVG